MTVTRSSVTTRQPRPPRRRLRRTGWCVVTVLCFATLALHSCGASVALAVGPFQFLPVQAWLPFHSVYTATAWLCWVPNLLVALWITRARPAPSTPQRRNPS